MFPGVFPGHCPALGIDTFSEKNEVKIQKMLWLLLVLLVLLVLVPHFLLLLVLVVFLLLFSSWRIDTEGQIYYISSCQAEKSLLKRPSVIR